jgi:rhodanese-related sulfurtransferase
MLSVTTDHFIRHAIVNGRQGTKMAAFGEKLNSGEIDAVTAFIRSRATGWEVLKPVIRTPPTADEYVLNPNGEPPEFELKDNLYVMSKDLNKALEDKRRLVLLDTRSMSMWQMAHIEGSVPLPYYYDDVTRVADDLPRDGTWIVSYCECPRAAAEYVSKQLSDLGFKNTAVLWEGAYGWVGLGYPMSRGETTLADMNLLDPE